MRDAVGSTSWPNRHRESLMRLGGLLRQRGGRPLIALIGPGAVTRCCRPFLRDAARPATLARRIAGDAARFADQALRRLPWVRLKSLEPLELEAALDLPHELAVVDVSARVLAAVARDLPSAKRYRLDLARDPLPFVADAVIAFNVLSRIAARTPARDHLLAGLKPDGLLLIDDRSFERLELAPQFQPVGPKTHLRRIPAQDTHSAE